MIAVVYCKLLGSVNNIWGRRARVRHTQNFFRIHNVHTRAVAPVALSKFPPREFSSYYYYPLQLNWGLFRLYCGFFLTHFRFATSPTTRRVVGQMIYQNVRLHRDRCATKCLKIIRIFRDVSREKHRKMSHRE